MQQIVGTTPHRKNIVDDGKDLENRQRKILYRAGIGGAAISAVAMVATTLALRSQLAIVDVQLDNDPRSRQLDSAIRQMAPLADPRGFFYSDFASSGERLGRTRAHLQASMDLVEPIDLSSPATISSAGSIVNVAPRIRTTILAVRELERYVHAVADPADPTRLNPSVDVFDVREHLAIAGSDISRAVNFEYSDYQRCLRPVACHIASRPYQLPLNASTSGLFLSLGLLVVAASMRRKKPSEISDEEALVLGHTEKIGETDVRSDLSRGYRFVRYDLTIQFDT